MTGYQVPMKGDDLDMNTVIKDLRWTIPEFPPRVIVEALVSHAKAEERAAPKLWCMHVRGPDDVVPAPDYGTAVRWCDAFNERFAYYGKDLHDFYPKLSAFPVLWGNGADIHAELLKIVDVGEYAWCTIPTPPEGE